MKKLGKFLTSRPISIDILLLLFVVTHAALTLWNKIPNIWGGQLGHEKLASLEALYIGALGAGAIVAGFAGVLVIFALSAPGERFRKLRIEGGKPLLANWITTSVSGFIATALFLIATVMSVLWNQEIAPFLFELGVLVLSHGAIRLLWLLREMVGIVRAEDDDKSNPDDSAQKFF